MLIDLSTPERVVAFTTREGGVSEGPLASLNLGSRPGERPEALEENWRRVRAGLGCAEWPLALVNQVHGDAVVETAEGGFQGEADAIVVRRPGLLAAVRVADCVPILLGAPGAVAAVHAGWRGTAARIAEKCARRLEGPVEAWIGPAIGPCCYEVGPEVQQALGCGRMADLWALNEAQLRAAGVERVQVVRECTRCSPRLFSHRRDPASGRQVGIVGIRP